ncbi:MAG TPA: M20/M25/M40 family metallo-hydrolase [Gemmatimonadaceae bacterium]|nr:M20/M25/M40 family metallo-hydrolase [Gemmatimonadaceae bacterium]
MRVPAIARPLLLLSTLAACAGSGGRVSPPPVVAAPAGPLALSPIEASVRDYVRAHHEQDIALLERAVNISSGTQNLAGVRRVGDLFAAELSTMGFSVRWAEMPASMRRAGHLVAERKGTKGARLLLIGHLDTVFEGEGQRFVREDSMARGAGTSDMKGGDVAMLTALRALNATGALEGSQIIVVMTGDEESAGSPLELSRKDLIDAAKRSDIALAFEGGRAARASIARRGSSGWTLNVTGRQGHSAGVFANGYGAVYEMARILDGFRRELAGDPTLTFNPGLVAGGTTVQRDSAGTLVAAGKTNIISPTAIVQGDLRFLRETQKDSARARMREIVAQHLPGTSAEILFRDSYPAMPPTTAGAQLLAQFDAVSRSLGYGMVEGDPPESRGAGDVSFVAPYLTGMDGLGVSGRGAHSPEESVNLNTLTMAGERAAVLMYRLITGPTLERPRP